ncbi:MAG: 30S ribosomal protein S4e [Haloferacaceae archaeon]
MSNHQKRLSVPKSWPVERKTETFTIKAGAGPHGESGVPLLIVMRDVLGYADSKKEAQHALNENAVLVNGDAVSDVRRPIGMFDILEFTLRDEHYRVFPGEGGRLSLTPIDEADAESRLGKIVRKQQVAGGDTQLTLHDGINVRVADGSDYSTDDSLVIDNETKDIVAHFPFEEGALVTAIAGTHAGEIGTVEEITVTAGSGNNTVAVAQESGDGFETIEQYVVVIDENFTDDEGEEPDDAVAEAEPQDEEVTEE